MTRFKSLILAAALGGTAIGGTAIGGTAFAAQDQAAPPPPPPGMHHHGHGDMLAKLDANHDGQITRAEAIAGADARFAKLDTNGDGQITPDEMKARRDAMRAKWQQRRAARGDQPAGQPGPDGQPSMGGQHGMRGHHGGMMMRGLDADNNGTITKAEAEAAATKHFDMIDTNHDGVIDQTEMAAAKAKMQERRQAMHAKWQARHQAQQQPDDAQ